MGYPYPNFAYVLLGPLKAPGVRKPPQAQVSEETTAASLGCAGGDRASERQRIESSPGPYSGGLHSQNRVPLKGSFSQGSIRVLEYRGLNNESGFWAHYAIVVIRNPPK